MSIGAGELNVCAELQKKVETVTTAGGRNPGWVPERDIWCSIRGLSPKLKLEAMAREPAITHEIIVRQEDDVDPTKRIVIKGTRAIALKFYYKCDEGSGTRADSGTNGLDVPQLAPLTGNQTGIINLAVKGTGNPANRLEASTNPLWRGSDPSGLTVTGWIKLPIGGAAANNPLMHYGFNDAAQKGWKLWHRPLGGAGLKLRFAVSDDGATEQAVSWGADTPEDAWMFVAAWHDPVAQTINISVNDGTPVSVAHTTGVFESGSGAAFGIACIGPTVGTAGVDELAGFDRVLSAEEITYLYGGGNPPSFDVWGGPSAFERSFMIAGIPEDMDERGAFVRMMAVEGGAT